MNKLSSHPKNVTKLILLSLVVLLLGPACLTSVALADAPAALPTAQDPFSSYGFEVAGFTSQQEELILKTLDAYAQALGSREQLRKIITAFNGGESWKITYNPEIVGANTRINLSPTVFSLEKARAARYSSYSARNNEDYSQIVLGHEISHLLVWATTAQTGSDWSQSYKERVQRDWQGINDSQAPEQEAVTELSLKVLQMGYYFSLDKKVAETDPEILAAIDGWTEDFVASLKSL